MKRSERRNGPIARAIAGAAAIFSFVAAAAGVWLFVTTPDLRIVGAVLAVVGAACLIPFGFIAITGREPSTMTLWP